MSVPDLATREQVIPEANPSGYEQVKCPMPRCGEDLYIEYAASRPVFMGDTAEELAEVGTGGAYSSDWKIGCAAGHVILVPIDTAADSYTFGTTQHCAPPGSPEPCDATWCEHGDMDRLRTILAALR